jgi:hypothetical protein
LDLANVAKSATYVGIVDNINNAGVDAAKKVVQGLDKVADNKVDVEQPKKDSDEFIEYTGPYADNKAFAVSGIKVKDISGAESVGRDTSNQLLRIKYGFEPLKNPAKEIEALSRQQMLDVLDKAQKLSDDIASFKKNESGLNSIRKSLDNVVETVLKTTAKRLEDSGDKKDAHRAIKAAQELVTDINANLGKISTSIPGIAFTAVSRSISYVSGSIANWKTKE